MVLPEDFQAGAAASAEAALPAAGKVCADEIGGSRFKKRKMNFIIETKKSKDEILQIIRNNTYITTSVFDFSKGDKYFAGKVSENSFKIFRHIHHKNSFLPLIIGTVEENEYGSTIKIKMRMATFVTFFLSVWFGGVIAACLIFPFAGFPMPSALIPYLMLVFGILLVVIPNKSETEKAKEKLEELLK